MELEPCRGLVHEVEACGGAISDELSIRHLENCNSNEDHPYRESVHTRRYVVRGADDLLTQLWRSRWAVLHGIFDGCGNCVSVGDP